MYDKTTILGRVGGEVQLRFTPAGREVANFSVAVDRYQGPNKDRLTIWYRCTAWGSLAVMLNERLNKGQAVYIEGNLVTNQADDDFPGENRVWEDKNGNHRSTPELNVREFRFAGGSNGTNGQSTEAEVQDVEEEEVPF